jgi:hypothetical protein
MVPEQQATQHINRQLIRLLYIHKLLLTKADWQLIPHRQIRSDRKHTMLV